MHKNRTFIAYASTMLLSLMFIVFSKADFSLDIKKIYAVVLFPFQHGAQRILRNVSDFRASISELSRLRTELQMTRERLSLFENAAVEYEEIKNENKRLAELLQQQKQIEYRTVLAAIISKDPQSFYNTIIVNRGYQDDVEVGMPVIAYRDGMKGVVGKVIEVSRKYSKILPVIDENCKIGGMLEASRATGILSGQNPRSLMCHLQYIDRNVLAVTNDTVVTSGFGGVFPKGLIIGTVAKIDRKNYGLFQDIYIKPLIDFSTLEDVYIIKKRAEDEFIRMLDRR